MYRGSLVMQKVGFLVWNQFQVAHFAEIAKHFSEPDFIFIDRSPEALAGFNASWLVPYGAYCRFISELQLQSLDGQYDAVISQFRPPLRAQWRVTKLMMLQYSLAKPKTAYNARWFIADHGLVYGSYSDSIIRSMCSTSQVGNPRFDPYFEGRLDPEITERLKENLDRDKKTILYLPTWGDLSTADDFSCSFRQLAKDYNVIVRQHHLANIRGRESSLFSIPGIVDANSFPSVLDIGVYLLKITDVVVSDMSGAIFDALYCRKPVVLIGNENVNYEEHKKADEDAIEITQRKRIGPYVPNSDRMYEAVQNILESGEVYKADNEKLVAECFKQRGGCAPLAAEAIQAAIDSQQKRPPLQKFAAPDFVPSLLSKATTAAKRRRSSRKYNGGNRFNNNGQSYLGKVKSRLYSAIDRSGKPQNVARLIAATKKRFSIDNKSSSFGNKKEFNPKKLNSLLREGEFFGAGLELERWRRANQIRRAKTFRVAYKGASAIRFSRTAWKESLSKLFRGEFSPSTSDGAELLHRLGMVRTADELYKKMGLQPLEEIRASIKNMGTFSDVLDVAARNEVSNNDWQMCISPNGKLEALSGLPDESVVELYNLLSLSQELKDEDQRPYRPSLQEFSKNIFGALLKLGVHVYPRIQAGILGAPPVSGKRASLTWHTLDSGFRSQLHIKIGSLFGHFILDRKGYSGWASVADKELGELIEKVNAEAAHTHWCWLYDDLVKKGKSKYLQELAPQEDFGQYIFLPLQVVDDAVAELADLDTLTVLNTLMDWAKTKKSDLSIVVKRHPMCKNSDIAEAIDKGQREGRIRVSNANIHHLIAGAECIVTVNSGVGAEALLQLKPVIATGRSDYAPITKRARTVEELIDSIDRKLWENIKPEDIKKFLWFYTRKYMVHYADESAILERLSELLGQVNVKLSFNKEAEVPELVFPISTSIPFLTSEEMFSGGGKHKKNMGMESVGEECDELLKEFRSQGVSCWIDSGSLLGLIRHGNLNDWEKDIDLGIWAEDYEAAKRVCQIVAKRFDLRYREKWIDDIPYALLLNSRLGGDRQTLPISVHVFYRIDGCAWSPQPHSLVAAKAKYPRYRYREEINRSGRHLKRKVGFIFGHPRYSLCMLISRANLAKWIGRKLREVQRPKTATERVIIRLFNEVFEWKIPARYFEDLQPISESHHHMLVPSHVHEYLRERYGDWEVPVKEWFYLVDDGCIALAPRKELKEKLEKASRDFSSLVVVPENI